jgi:hypothetical protein
MDVYLIKVRKKMKSKLVLFLICCMSAQAGDDLDDNFDQIVDLEIELMIKHEQIKREIMNDPDHMNILSTLLAGEEAYSPLASPVQSPKNSFSSMNYPFGSYTCLDAIVDIDPEYIKMIKDHEAQDRNNVSNLAGQTTNSVESPVRTPKSSSESSGSSRHEKKKRKRSDSTSSTSTNNSKINLEELEKEVLEWGKN